MKGTLKHGPNQEGISPNVHTDGNRKKVKEIGSSGSLKFEHNKL